MQIRLAKPTDAQQLAGLHLVCSAEHPEMFIPQLGLGFLIAYYRILLSEKSSLVLCAEAENGCLVALVSGTLAAEEHFDALKRNKSVLLLATIPALLRNPKLAFGIYSRQSSGSADENDTGYVVLSGPREEFWVCLPNYREGGLALDLHKKWLALMRLLGATTVKFEVDSNNEKVSKMHRLMGAHMLREFVTPDGKTRGVMEYVLQ